MFKKQDFKKKRIEKSECIQRYQYTDSMVLHTLFLSSFLATFKCRFFARIAYWCLYVHFFLFQKKKEKRKENHKYLFDGIVAMDDGYWILSIHNQNEIQCSVEFHFDNIYIKWRHSFDIMTMKMSISLYKHILLAI